MLTLIHFLIKTDCSLYISTHSTTDALRSLNYVLHLFPGIYEQHDNLLIQFKIIVFNNA